MTLTDIPYSTLQKNGQGYEILLLRDQHGLGFAAIGREFHITPEKARHIYEMVYHRKVLAYVEQMQAQAGHEAGGWNVWQRYLAGNVSAKTRYERLLAEQGKI